MLIYFVCICKYIYIASLYHSISLYQNVSWMNIYESYQFPAPHRCNGHVTWWRWNHRNLVHHDGFRFRKCAVNTIADIIKPINKPKNHPNTCLRRYLDPINMSKKHLLRQVFACLRKCSSILDSLSKHVFPTEQHTHTHTDVTCCRKKKLQLPNNLQTQNQINLDIWEFSLLRIFGGSNLFQLLFWLFRKSLGSPNVPCYQERPSRWRSCPGPVEANSLMV